MILAIVKLNLESQLFNELDSQIEKLDLVIKQGTLIDALIVQADVKQPKPNDQGKGGKSAHDPDASWTKKYDKSYFGYKMHIGVDQHSGVIRKKVFTPADVHDSQCFKKLVVGDEDMAYADRAYTSTKNDTHLKQLGVKNGILFKQAKKLPV